MADWTKGQGKTTLLCPCAPVFIDWIFCFDRLRLIVCLFQGKGQNNPAGRYSTGHLVKSGPSHLPGLGSAPGVPEPSSSSRSRNLTGAENGNDGATAYPQICRAGGTISSASWKNRPMGNEGHREETGFRTHDRNQVQKRTSLRHPSGCRRADHTCRLDCPSPRRSRDRPGLSAPSSFPTGQNTRKAVR